MWKWLARRRRARFAQHLRPIETADIDAARSVLFAVFARYGDSVIAFKTISRFVRRYPDKQYTLVTTPQALPYAEAIVGSGVTHIGINKRRTPWRLFQLLRRLCAAPPDLGFNPWSHGAESEFIIGYAKHFFPYRDFAHFSRVDNLYRRIYDYLKLPVGQLVPRRHVASDIKRIVLSPFSTDVRKGLDSADLEKLITQVRRTYRPQEIVVALFPDEAHKTGVLEVRRFFFDKSRARSEEFLALLRDTDLFIGVDAGPLHLADTLGIPSLGIFGPTAPETILDVDSGVTPLRIAAMAAYFCDVRACLDPVCLHKLFDSPSPLDFVAVDAERKLVLEIEVCRAK